MKVFFKANAASFIATFCDYTATVILKEFLFVPPVIASVLGTITGGVINFFICRRWVFKANEVSIYSQSKRYLLTWTGNLLLNTLGVYILIGAGVNYVVAKIITSVVVMLAYNYPLQKKYVFKNNLNNES